MTEELNLEQARDAVRRADLELSYWPTTRLAALADIQPDATDAAAQWLNGIRVDVRERLDYMDADVLNALAATDHPADLADIERVIHETADAAVPVYTRDLWALFVAVAGWRHDDILEDLGAGEDMERGARIILCVLGERVAEGVVNEHAAELAATLERLAALDVDGEADEE